MNALQLCAEGFHTKKLCSRLSSSEVHFLMKIGRFAFLRPPLSDLGVTYDDHLRLIGKRVVNFLLALIELFSLGVTCLLYTSPSPRDGLLSRMPSSA